jgi:tRNA A-37 threonylcarbamoyl transferase component Bud32
MDLEAFEADNLRFEEEVFDPCAEPLRSKVLALLESLGVHPSCEIDVLCNLGGLNEGMWSLHGKSRQGALVLKLVQTQRRHPLLPSDVENILTIIERRPSIINEHALAFPIKILHCIGPGDNWSHDLIVMRRAPGHCLDTTLATKCALGQIDSIMQDLDQLGCLLAQIHSVYGMQHGDLQPSNVFHDEDNEWFTLIDCGGMGPNPYANDDDLHHLCEGIKLVTPNMSEEFQAEVKRHLEAGYRREMEAQHYKFKSDAAK